MVFESDGQEAFESLLIRVVRESAFDRSTLLEVAKERYDREDYKNSLFLLEEVTGDSHAEACYMIGKMHEYGLGTEKDISKARDYYESSAKKGYTPAIITCGRHNLTRPRFTPEYGDYFSKASGRFSGEGAFCSGLLYDPACEYYKVANINESRGCALGLYKIAAGRDHAEAAFRIAQVYEFPSTEDGVKIDYDKALYYLTIAANQNHSLSLGKLGFFYETGKGVNKDSSKAFEYYKRSAQLGNPLACRTIALYILNSMRSSVDAAKCSEALKYLEDAFNGGVPGCQTLILACEDALRGKKTNISDLVDECFSTSSNSDSIVAMQEKLDVLTDAYKQLQEKNNQLVASNKELLNVTSRYKKILEQVTSQGLQ